MLPAAHPNYTQLQEPTMLACSRLRDSRVRANTKYDGKKLGRGKAAPPFPRSRFHVLTFFHVPFNYASSLLTESLEQATTIISMSNVLKLHGSKQTKAVFSSLTVFYLPEVSHGVWLYCIPGFPLVEIINNSTYGICQPSFSLRYIIKRNDIWQ